MQVLVVYGSKRAGTEGIARAIGDELATAGLEVRIADAATKPLPDAYDAVVVGGALYAFRWHKAARRFVKRNAAALGTKPVWLFSSGPLDDSAHDRPPVPVKQVEKLMGRIGARGHTTFGGRLAHDAKGFPASAMAKKNAGDWRNWDDIRTWARTIATELTTNLRRSSTSRMEH